MMEEKKGVSAWLRGIVDESYGKESRPLCTGIVEPFFGVKCRKMHTCGSCILEMLTAIADRIDADRALPDGIEWPRFEDGELVKVGDEVEFEGEAAKVLDVAFSVVKFSLGVGTATTSGRVYGFLGEPAKRPAPKVLDADGVPIKVGDTVYCDDDPEQLIVDSFDDPRCVYITLAKSPNGILYTVEPSRLTHEFPDSWERIEEDAKLAPRDYLEKRGMNPEKTERIASMMADLVRRAKALAKAGESE